MLRQIVEESADDVSHRVTAERVAGEQRRVQRQHERPDTDAELRSSRAVAEPECLPYVVRQEEQEQHRDVEEVPVNVLENEREVPLAEVAVARLAYGAVRRVRPERLVIGAAVVVAGEPE